MTAKGNTVTKTGGGGEWNGGATSWQTVTSGEGYVQITVDSTTTDKAFGLGNGNTNAGLGDIEFAMFLQRDGTLTLYRSGSPLPVNVGNYAVGDTLRVAVDGNGTVQWYRNATLLHAETNQTIDYPLLLDVSIYTEGAQVTDAYICGGKLNNPPVPVCSKGQLAEWANLSYVTTQGANIVKTGGGGEWNGGATSWQTITSGEGYVQITVDSTTTHKAFGLGNGNSNAGLGDIEFGMYLRADGRLLIYKSGSPLPADSGNYEVGDVLKVAVEYDTQLPQPGHVVRWYRNSTRLYTDSTTPIAYPLLLDVSIYTEGAQFTDAYMCSKDLSNPPVPACSNGQLVEWANLSYMTASGNTVTKTGGGGEWNGGATSWQTITSGEGYVQITVDSTTTHKAFGLGNGNSNAGLGDIEFGMYLRADGRLLIYKSGSPLPADSGNYEVGDVLKVAVEYDTQLPQPGHVVRWYRNSTRLYTDSTTPIAYPLLLDVSIYTEGAQFTGAFTCSPNLNNPLPPGCKNSQAIEWANLSYMTVSGNTVTKTGGGGEWNGGATSWQTITSGEGYVQITVDSTTTEKAFGLGHDDSNAGLGDIEFGMRLQANGRLLIYKSGSPLPADSGNYEVGDVLKVAVEHDAGLGTNVIRWYRNSTRLYSDTPSAVVYPLHLDVSIYTLGAKFANAEVYVCEQNLYNPPVPVCGNGQLVEWTDPANMTVSGNTVTKTGGGADWNGGATSWQTIASGEGYVQITVDSTTTHKAFGLGNGNSNAGLGDIEFGMYLRADGRLLIYRSGSPLPADSGNYNIGDVLKVAVEYDAVLGHKVVRWYRNTTRLHSDNNPTLNYPILLDASIYTEGAQFTGVYMCSPNLTNRPIPVCGTGYKVDWTNLVNVAASGNSITKTGGGSAWDAGAVSVETITSGEGYVQVSVDVTTTHKVFGLGNGDSNAGLGDIEFGMYLRADGKLLIYRSGSPLPADTGNYEIGDVLKVAVEYDTQLVAYVVRWYRNNVRLYSDTTTSIVYPLLLDTSIYSQGAQITDAFICTRCLLGAPGQAEIGGAGSPSEQGTTCCTDNPVNLVTGNFWHTFTDVFIPGRGIPLLFSRTYNSKSASLKGPLGHGWTHNYNMYIERDQNNHYLVHEENGSIVPFEPDFSHAPRVMATLTETNGVLIFTRTHDQDRFYFKPVMGTPMLSEIVDRNGYSTTLSYQGSLLRTVTEPGSRTLTFTYTNGLLTTARDSGNRTFSFGYDANNDLRTATDIGGQISQFTYDSAHRLRTWTDPLNRVLTNVYDSSNRVIQQTDPLGNILLFDYTPNLTTMTDITTGLVSVYDHSNNMLRQETANPGTQQVGWSYDYKPDTASIASETDPQGRTWNYTWDLSGDRTSVTDPLGRTTQYTYTLVPLQTGYSMPLVASERDALGRATSFEYNNRGQPTVMTRTDTLNQVTHFVYDNAGRLVRTVDPAGVMECREYDSNDYLTAVVRNCRLGEPTAGSQNVRTEYGYDALGRRLWERNPLGEVTRTFYTPDDRLIKTVVGCAVSGVPSITDCDGFRPETPELNRTTSFGYDTFGRQVTMTDTVGIVTRTEYDTQGRVWRTTRNYDPTRPADASTNVTTTTEYDAAGRVSATLDPLGRRTVPGYDLLGRVVTQTQNYVDGDPLTGDPDTDLVTHTDYNSIDLPITMTANYVDGIWDPTKPDEDLSTVTRYDELNRQVTTIENYVDGISGPGEVDTDRITQYLYDAVGNRIATIDPLGRVSVSVYDDLSRIVEEIRNCTDGNGQPRTSNCATGHGTHNDENIRTRMAYNARGELERRTDPLGRYTFIRYDALGRIVEQVANEGGAIPPANVKTQYGYDAVGQMTVITDALQGLQRSEYNRAGWLERRIDPTNRAVRYVYDGLGRQVRQIDALNREGRSIYDALGRPIKNVTNWQNGVVEPGDAPDADLTTEMMYDAAGRLLMKTGADGRCTNYTNDGLDRLTGVRENTCGPTAPINPETRYGYDRRGLLKTITDVMGRQRQRGYNAAGWQVSETDALNRTTTYGYDRAGRRVSVTDPRPITAIYANDGLDRVISITAPNLTPITMQYDIGSRRGTMSDETGVTSYTYDGLDRQTQAAHSVDGTVTSGYDLLGRRTSLGTSTGAPAISNFYDEAGRLKEVYKAQTLYASAQFDTVGRLQSLTRANGATTTYSYDGADRIRELRTVTGSTLRSDFTYLVSRGSQITTTTETIGLNTRTIAYTYDGLRRLLQASEQPGHTYAYTYDLAGNRTEVRVDGTVTESRAYDPADQVIGWQYDLAGDLLNDGVNTYTYDALKRLTGVTRSGSAIAYGYNGNGVLATETSGGATTRYTLDTTGGLPERLGATRSGSTTWYVRGWGQELTREAGGVSTWLLGDHLGSIRAQMDGAGSLIAGYDYDPYGTPEGSSQPTDYGYTGEPQNATTGLVHLRARWYNTNAGGFLSYDPNPGRPDQPQSLHRYLYSVDDPVNRVDPTGMTSYGCLAQPYAAANIATKCSDMVREVRRIVDKYKRIFMEYAGTTEGVQSYYYRANIAAELGVVFAKIPWKAAALMVENPNFGLNWGGAAYNYFKQIIDRSYHQGANNEMFVFEIPQLRDPDPRAGEHLRYLDAGLVHMHKRLPSQYYSSNANDPLKEAAAVAYVRREREYSWQVFNYGFKDNYWTNSHHYFAYFFLGFAANSLVAIAENHYREDRNHPPSQADYVVGARGGVHGEQFRKRIIDPDSLPDFLRAEMCDSSAPIGPPSPPR